jgi:hypothetical protein
MSPELEVPLPPLSMTMKMKVHMVKASGAINGYPKFDVG